MPVLPIPSPLILPPTDTSEPESRPRTRIDNSLSTRAPTLIYSPSHGTTPRPRTTPISSSNTRDQTPSNPRLKPRDIRTTPLQTSATSLRPGSDRSETNRPTPPPTSAALPKPRTPRSGSRSTQHRSQIQERDRSDLSQLASPASASREHPPSAYLPFTFGADASASELDAPEADDDDPDSVEAYRHELDAMLADREDALGASRSARSGERSWY